jgi:hypothetical protein
LRKFGLLVNPYSAIGAAPKKSEIKEGRSDRNYFSPQTMTSSWRQIPRMLNRSMSA